MKGFVKNYFPKQLQPILSALVLTGILSLSIGLTLLQIATAASSNAFLQVSGEMVKGQGKLISERDRGNRRAHSLPRPVASPVRLDLSRKLGIPPSQLKIIDYSRQTWPNGCLGLARTDEACTEALVAGWRITLSNGCQTWVYRTDLQGQVLRLEPQTATVNLPESVANAVLQDASEQTGLPISKLRILEAKPQTWPDGCLGLASPGKVCTQALVPGWLVTVETGQQRLVYRTNENGSALGLDTAVSQTDDAGTIKPVPIPTSELPPPLQDSVIFRAIASGGIAGRTYETNLFKDGRVLRVLVKPNGTTSQAQTDRISQQQVREFQQVLEQQQFARFNGLKYPAPSGAADYISYTLTSQAGTTRYTDINQDRLPSSLQAVIRAWNRSARGR